MPMVAEVVDAVVGGDTHSEKHVLEMLTATGVVLATATVDNDAAGYAEAVRWIGQHCPGPRLLIGLEGTRSYGVGLARAVQAAGLPVVEVERPRRSDHRRGKSDPIDAHLAALQVLRMDAEKLPTPRADGDREALRILLTARTEMTNTKTRQVNRLRALLLTGDDADRQWCRGSLSDARLGTISRRRGRAEDTAEQTVRRAEARRLCRAIIDANRELKANKKQLTALADRLAPELRDQVGIGPVSAAQLLVSWSHRGRCRDEAAFAALAGVNPIPASSGNTSRHRHNRGGDRQLNQALHHITLTRIRICPHTQAYFTRRRAEGKHDKEIRRCIKRYIARQTFRILQNSTLDNT
jgi:transposase